MLYTSVPVCFLLISCAVALPEHAPSSDAVEPEGDPPSPPHPAPLEKRSPHYDFGLGKRAYSYVSEYKRLPVYNFGLGKRSRPYSFGLGKRSISDEQTNEISNDVDPASLAEFLNQYDEESGYDEKRARPYSFGLGKRFYEDSSEEKRARMYDFGLGKRLPMYNFGLGKRARNYNFGLGKRLSSKFNFGLGKRERDLNRFSFGLGKRSDVSNDDSENYSDV
ncbi:allatostatin-A [Plodia interpunctella]|uniref:allatostatin-A n=1 Tax=Plodia interpunctella TaxID=58824 RepID=UPI0023689024|nr:allatostatin-A [Plodia interpunctella]